MENITLYEAMEIIDEYLTEKAPRGAYKKYNKMMSDKLDKIEDEQENLINKRKKLREINETNPHAQIFIDANKAKYKNLNNEWNKVSDKHNDITGSRVSDIDKAVYDSHKNRHLSSRDKENIMKAKEAFGQGQDPRSELEKKPAGLYATKESVSSTKLRIYKAYNNDIITESDKNDLLQLLNFPIVKDLGISLAVTGGSAVALKKVNKKIKDIEKDLKNEEHKIDGDKTKIRRLTDDLKKLKALRVALVGTTAAGAARTAVTGTAAGVGLAMIKNDD